MAFKEKSAWVMMLALIITAFMFGNTILGINQTDTAQVPLLPVFIAYVVILTIISVVGHIIIAVMSPKDANASTDERERGILDRAGNQSSFLLGLGVISGLLIYLLNYDGNWLFYAVFSSLLFSQMAEYALQIYYFRKGGV